MSKSKSDFEAKKINDIIYAIIKLKELPPSKAILDRIKQLENKLNYAK
jgi:hypothetical protein